jgi:SAM-dependent methyltransferase
MTKEIDRIKAEYARRAREIPAERYSSAAPSEIFLRQSRERAVLKLLARAGALPLAGRRILDVGCGTGQWLADLETWGATRETLAGIDLLPDRADQARSRMAALQGTDGVLVSRGADIRLGDASELPWPQGSFDIVLQSTVFSSILDPAFRARVASEMARVLAPTGLILWNDLRVNNPRNPSVRGVRREELARLFPGFVVSGRRITLLPPLARRLVRLSFGAAQTIEALRLLNTHYVAVLTRSAA